MLKPKQKKELWEQFKALGVDAFRMNHYALSLTNPEITADVWKEFLTEPDVAEYIASETELLQEAEFRNILLNTTRDNSAGRAQLLNAMQAINNKQQKKEGPVVIYSYIPLNEQQLKAPNIEINEKDPFRR